jgi:hypothetical protein
MIPGRHLAAATLADLLHRRCAAHSVFLYIPENAGIPPPKVPSSQNLRNTLGFLWNGHSIHPLDAVRVKRQLVRRDHIVKYSHLALAHHDELLFLEGVQPTHKDMCVCTAGKLKVADGDIGYRAVQIVATLRGNPALASRSAASASLKYRVEQNSTGCFLQFECARS